MKKMADADRAVFASVILYAIAMFLPAVVMHTGIGIDIYYGYSVLLTGWMDLIEINPAWLANIFYWMAVRSTKNGLTYSTIGLMLSLLSFLTARQLLIGYYIWELSFVFLLLARISSSKIANDE